MVMKFRRGGRHKKTDKFKLAGKSIEVTNSFTYLGVTLKPLLGFTKHIERIKTRAIAASAAFLTYFLNCL